MSRLCQDFDKTLSRCQDFFKIATILYQLQVKKRDWLLWIIENSESENRQEVKSSITQNTIIIGKSRYWSVKAIFLISSFLLALHLSSTRKTDVLWQGVGMKYIQSKSTLVLIPFGYVSIHWAIQPLVVIFVKSLIESTHKDNCLDFLVAFGSLWY